MSRRSFVAFLGVMLLLFANVRGAKASVCTPSFPLEHGKALGWQGADAAYSTPLPDGRDVWIFGDTLYGTTLGGRGS